MATIIELPTPARRSGDSTAGLRHLHGIVIAGGAQDRPFPSHYSAPRGRRLRCVDSQASREMALVRTLERAMRLIPAERMIAVLERAELARHAAALAEFADVRVVVQPAWRGSAAQIFLPALRIHRDDPHATVVVLPHEQVLDHDARLMHYVARAARAADIRPDIPIVIGAPPRSPDPHQPWIEPGEPVEGLETLSIRTVQRFVGPTSPREATTLFEGNGLLSTLVVIAKAKTLISLGRRYLPDVLETLEPLEDAFDGPEERLLCDAVYECMPVAGITAGLLERARQLAVLPIPGVVWREDAARLPLAS
jgi:mannose-1-phosphate guanylyltransferase